MADKLLWIARTDGAGWNSSRTRDAVDLGFTVYRSSGSSSVSVEVREPYHNSPNSRARWVAGRVFFNTVEEAKLAVSTLLDAINAKYPTDPEFNITRGEFYANLLNAGLESGVSAGSPAKSYIYLGGGIRYKTVTTHPTVSKLPVPGSSMEEQQEALNAVVAERVDSMMKLLNETTEIVHETVSQPVVEEVKNKTIIINGKEMVIGWPS
jgi:hypothetical protein